MAPTHSRIHIVVLMTMVTAAIHCGPVCPPERTRPGAWGTLVCAPDEGEAVQGSDGDIDAGAP